MTRFWFLIFGALTGAPAVHHNGYPNNINNNNEQRRHFYYQRLPQPRAFRVFARGLKVRGLIIYWPRCAKTRKYGKWEVGQMLKPYEIKPKLQFQFQFPDTPR